MTRNGLLEIAALFEAAYSVTFTPQKLDAWLLLLDPLSDDEAKAAAVRMARESPYPPKPADLYTAARGTQRDVEQLLEDEAEAALAHFEGHFTDYEIADYGPVINAVVRDMGGLDAIGVQMVRDEWKFQRERFRTLYRVHRKSRSLSKEPLLPVAILENQYYALQGLDEAPRLEAPFQPIQIPGLPAPIRATPENTDGED
jgi:hypothetical protein